VGVQATAEERIDAMHTEMVREHGVIFDGIGEMRTLVERLGADLLRLSDLVTLMAAQKEPTHRLTLDVARLEQRIDQIEVELVSSAASTNNLNMTIRQMMTTQLELLEALRGKIGA
jgi:hypothetical protein